jgi:DNA-binding CsgD family transcriptional regulator/catechol 2,3-dioxygenase-like lactoylglutathione lyase family enzyme
MTKRGRPVHPDRLTPAEWRVVEGVRHGLTNPAIAELCDISVDAVKFHVSNALGKLGFKNRRELRQWPGIRRDSALKRQTEGSQIGAWTLGQVSRLTSNLNSSADWFRDTIGLKEVIRLEEMVFLECGELRVYLTEGDPKKNSILYFKVDDIHEEVKRLASASVEIQSAPHRIHVHPDGTEEWMAFFSDVDGCPLGLMSVVEQTKEEE